MKLFDLIEQIQKLDVTDNAEVLIVDDYDRELPIQAIFADAQKINIFLSVNRSDVPPADSHT